jgi:hypothetical protein
MRKESNGEFFFYINRNHILLSAVLYGLQHLSQKVTINVNIFEIAVATPIQSLALNNGSHVKSAVTTGQPIIPSIGESNTNRI